MSYNPDCGAVASPAVSIVGMNVFSPDLGLGVVMPRPEAMDAVHRNILKETETDWPYVAWVGSVRPMSAGLANPLELTAVSFPQANAKYV